MNFSASEICFCNLIFSLQLLILAKQYIFKSSFMLSVRWCRGIIAHGFRSGIFHQAPVCNKLDETACDRLELTSLLRFVSTNLLQVVNLHDTSLLSTICCSIVTTTLLQVRQQVCTSPSTGCYKSVRTSCYRQCEDILSTSCCNNIATSLLQACYNLCVFTRVLFKHPFEYPSRNASKHVFSIFFQIRHTHVTKK